MVSFPVNSPFSAAAEPKDEAVRLDAILPDVLRRYGLAAGPHVDRHVARDLPADRGRQIAESRRRPSLRD